jgi:hypothetical protein
MSGSILPSNWTTSMPAACTSAKVASEATTTRSGGRRPAQRLPAASITDQTARPEPRPTVIPSSSSSTAACAAAARAGENS